MFDQLRLLLHRLGRAKPGAGQSPRRREREPSLISGIAAISGLSALAFAQPIYEILRGAPEFFAIRDLLVGDVAALVVLLATIPTLVLASPAVVAHFILPAWSRLTVAVPVGLLAAVIALQATAQLPTAPAVGTAVAVGFGAVTGYVRLAVVRQFASLLASAAVLVPAFLLLDGDVRRSIVRPQAPVQFEETDTGARAPIVMVIFDEWSLTSVLDRNGEIDRERLPNLARLADTATWYPNATAAADTTEFGAPDPATFARNHRVFAITLRGVAVDLPVRAPQGPAGQPLDAVAPR